MDAMDDNCAIQLKELKSLFSKIIEVANQINVVHSSNILPNGHNENMGAKTSSNDGKTIPELGVGPGGNASVCKNNSSPNGRNVILGTKNFLNNGNAMLDVRSNGNNSANTNDVLRCIADNSADEHVNTLSNKKAMEQQMDLTQTQPQGSLSSPDVSHKIIPDTDVAAVNNSGLNICFRKGSCDNSQMIVETSGNDPKGKRLCCVYCQQRVIKLARHLESVHKEEAEVKRFLALPKKSKQRRNIQDSLRKRGTSEWNRNASINNNVMCTSRRPNGKVLKKATDFKTCPKCEGTYAVSCFSTHFNKCANGVLKGERSLLVISKIVEGRVHASANDRLAYEIFPKMQEDDIVRLVRFDSLIIIYGNDLCSRYTAVSQRGMIRNKIRMAGRLFNSIKSECSFVTDFASSFRPKCYNSMIAAIKSDIGKFDATTDEYGSCSPVLAAVTEVRKIGRMLIAELFKLEDESLDQLKKAENFVTLMESQETNTMLKTVRDTQRNRKRLKIENIPSNEDVNRLALRIESERIKYFNQLSEQYSYSVWLELSKLMAASIIVLNRKRTGETQWMLLTDFLARKSIDKDCKLPIYSALSEQEKKVARNYSQMMIRGKLGSDVQVLMSRNMEKSIELLVKHREDAGVNNEFLFGLPSAIKGQVKVVNACSVLVHLSTNCNAENPKSLRGTLLRKHIASFCVTLNLDDAAVGEVAKHMGHSEKVHQYYYRRNALDRDIVRMSKRLMAAQGMSDNIDGDTNDSDLEDEVNKENVGVAIIHDNTEKLTCQVNEVKGSMKTSAGRKRKKAEHQGQGGGIPDSQLTKKKRNEKSDGKCEKEKKRTPKLAKSN